MHAVYNTGHLKEGQEIPGAFLLSMLDRHKFSLLEVKVHTKQDLQTGTRRCENNNDNLIDALKFVLRIGFKEARTQHPKAVPQLWVKVDSHSSPFTARWCTIQPKSGSWFALSEDWLGSLHHWLMKNCFVTLGDRVWQQIKAFPWNSPTAPSGATFTFSHTN